MKTSVPLLISAAANAYWGPLPAPEEAHPVRLLALIAPYTEGSEEEALLQNILKACGLPPEQIAVQTRAPAAPAQLEVQAPLWRTLQAVHQPEVILLLGIPPAQLGIQARLPFILPQNFDGAVWIVGPSLAVLQQDRNLRQALWTEGLKPCFVS